MSTSMERVGAKADAAFPQHAKLRAATLAARERTGIPGLGTNVKAGRYSVVNVTYPKGSRAAVEVLKADLSLEEAIADMESRG